jgi:hypothetical protein
MSPATYVAKVPTFTAVQWDGSDDASTFIVMSYAGQARRQDEDMVIAGPVHDTTLPPGSWVVVEDGQLTPAVMSDDWFTAHYVAKA